VPAGEESAHAERIGLLCKQWRGRGISSPGEFVASLAPLLGARPGPTRVAPWCSWTLHRSFGIPDAPPLPRRGFFYPAWDVPEGSGVSDGDGSGIRIRYVDANGQPLFQPTTINQVTTGDQGATEVIATESGFLLTWIGSDSDGTGVRGQLVDPTGALLGDELVLPAIPTGDQRHGALAATPGGFVVAWVDETTPELEVRRFEVPLFGDGFESGATNRAVSATAQDMLAVRGKCAREDTPRMTRERVQQATARHIPQSNRAVIPTAQDMLAVRGKAARIDWVPVAHKSQ